MTPLSLALNSALLHLLWQGMAVALLLWFALAALRNRSAEARYMVSCAALGILTLAPVVTMCLVYQRPSGMTPIWIASVWIASVPAVFREPASAPTHWLTPTGWVTMMQAWILPVWAFGVALLSMRLLWAYAKVAGLKKAGDQAEPDVLALAARLAERLGVTRSVQVLISSLPYPSDGLGPCVIGWLRPVILLPTATLLGLTPEQLEAVLAHELAHIRRYDYLVNVFQMLIETLFFYHPAVWWISSRIRREREICCDDIAVRCCGDAIGYARALTALERMRVLASSPSPSLALGAKDGPLMYRIRRLVGAVPQPAPREQGPSRLPALLAILVAVGCFSIDMNPAKAQASLPQPPQPSAPGLSAPPPNRPPRAVLQLAQARQPIQPASLPVSSSNVSGPVTVEVTIDQAGQVSDARVISGPANQRRSALLMALNMRFPLDEASTTRQIDVLANTLPFGVLANTVYTFSGYAPIQPVVTQAEALKRLQEGMVALAKLKVQQAQASERGARQLQESIDSITRGLDSMQQIATGQNPLVGKMLEDIRVTGTSDEARDRLLARLPVRLHDVLSEASMAAAIRATREMFPYADAHFGTLRPDQAGFTVMIH